jgi:hypothetical protein
MATELERGKRFHKGFQILDDELIRDGSYGDCSDQERGSIVCSVGCRPWRAGRSVTMRRGQSHTAGIWGKRLCSLMREHNAVLAPGNRSQSLISLEHSERMISDRQMSWPAEFTPNQQLPISTISQVDCGLVLLFYSIDLVRALAENNLGNFSK